MLNVYCTGHRWSTMVCKAFARGAKAKIVPPAPLRDGDMFCYGCLRGLLPTILQAQREGRTYWFADNGYFRPGKTESSYFRITRNDLQHNGRGALPDGAMARWKNLGLKIEPWRTSGGHVLVCPPLRLAGATWGYDADEWLDQTVDTLRRHTDREIRVRAKMSWNDNKTVNTAGFEGREKPTNSSMAVTMAEDLRDCWALVTRTSNSAVEALLAGVPVFCTHPCAAEPMGLTDLSQIEAPAMAGGREEWAARLAANQWQLSEMRSGKCWEMLQSNL